MARIDVPGKFSLLSGNNDVYSANVPSVLDWARMADNLNYLKSKGSQLIPGFLGTYPFYLNFPGTSANNLSYEFVIFPSSQSLSRHWEISMKGVASYNSTATTIISSSIGRTTSPIIGIQPNIQKNFNVSITEILTQSNTPDVEFISITCSAASPQAASSSANIAMESISCFEIPRVYLDTTATKDNAIDSNSFLFQSPIFSDGLLKRSVNSMVVLSSASIHETRRNGMFFWALPIKSGSAYNYQGIPFGTGSILKTIFPQPVYIQSRRVFENETTGSVDVYFRIRNSGAAAYGNSTLAVNITSSIANSFASLVVATNTDCWISATINVKCDGTGSVNFPLGLSERDALTFKITTTSGPGRAYLYSICAGEKQKPL